MRAFFFLLSLTHTNAHTQMHAQIHKMHTQNTRCTHCQDCTPQSLRGVASHSTCTNAMATATAFQTPSAWRDLKDKRFVGFLFEIGVFVGAWLVDWENAIGGILYLQLVQSWNQNWWIQENLLSKPVKLNWCVREIRLVGSGSLHLTNRKMPFGEFMKLRLVELQIEHFANVKSKIMNPQKPLEQVCKIELVGSWNQIGRLGKFAFNK